MVPKMILRLDFVDLADVALSELSAPSGRAPPEFSYMPLSQCKLQAVCCRERLHVTVFGKIANLSLGQAPSCTKILFFDNDPWFSQIATSFSQAISVLHRVHCCEEDCLSSLFEACSSWNYSISLKRILFVRVPDVVEEILGKSFRNQQNVLQCKINSTFS